MTPLSDRIADALQGEPSPDDLEALIREAEAARHALGSDRAVAHLTARDPHSVEAVLVARTDEQRLAFDEERLGVALDRLRARHDAAVAHVEEVRRRELHAEVTAERDAVAAELAERYPALASELADLLAPVAAANARVEAVNRAGGPWLDRVETVARGVPANGIHFLLTATRLPPWEVEAQAHGRTIWPQTGPIAAVLDPATAAFSAARGNEMRRIGEAVEAKRRLEATATRRKIA